MPLRVDCASCGRQLLVDEGFHGAYCRCRYCRRLLPVPSLPASSLNRPIVRPERPPLADTGSERVRTTLPTRSPPSKTAPHQPGTLLARLRSPASLVVLAATVTTCLAVISWQAAMPTGPARHRMPIGSVTGGSAAADEEQAVSQAALLASADPLRTYFARPLIGETVLFVVDGDNSMMDYFDPVKEATNAVIRHRTPGERRIGVIAASGAEGPQVVWAESGDSDLAGASSVLAVGLSSERSDLATAVGRTVNLQASHIFVVLAKRLDAGELASLAENAQQTGAVVDFVALGEARAQEAELQSISEPTHGQVLSMTSSDLANWGRRVGKAVEAAEEAAPR
jgi:hypothetical protein